MWVLRLHGALVGSQIALLIGTLRFHLATQGGGGWLNPLTPPPRGSATDWSVSGRISSYWSVPGRISSYWSVPGRISSHWPELHST